MDLRHALLQLSCEIPAAQMDVVFGGFQTAMAGESRNFVNIPTRSSQVRQA